MVPIIARLFVFRSTLKERPHEQCSMLELKLLDISNMDDVVVVVLSIVVVVGKEDGKVYECCLAA